MMAKTTPNTHSRTEGVTDCPWDTSMALAVPMLKMSEMFKRRYPVRATTIRGGDCEVSSSSIRSVQAAFVQMEGAALTLAARNRSR